MEIGRPAMVKRRIKVFGNLAEKASTDSGVALPSSSV
jgi:hypothetical protein